MIFWKRQKTKTIETVKRSVVAKGLEKGRMNRQAEHREFLRAVKLLCRIPW